MFKTWCKAVVLVASVLSTATVNADSEMPEPYRELPASMEKNFPELKNQVTVFFQFSCPHCRRLHQQRLDEWAETLPPKWGLMYVPVVASDDDMPGAATFFALMMLDKSKLKPFVAKAFELVHERNADASNLRTYIAAAKMVGADGRKLLEILKNSSYSKLMERYHDIASESGIESVPQVAVGAKTVADPSIVTHDYGLFLRLLNGLISQQLDAGI